jgi:hypothetical protein
MGTIKVEMNTQLWGAETNGLFNLYRSDCFAFTLLGGLRYLGLEENLTISGESEITTVTGPSTFQSLDRFRTQNLFFGGQIGARADFRAGPWALGLLGKVALGNMNEQYGAQGGQVLDGVFLPVGAFARSSNPLAVPGLPAPTNGTFNTSRLAVVPEGRVEVGYDLGRHTTLNVGYTFLYVNRVLRPGEVLPSTLVLALPETPFKQTDFWAQGLDVGLTFSW